MVDLLTFHVVKARHIGGLLVKCHHSLVIAINSTAVSSVLECVHDGATFGTYLFLKLSSHFMELLFIKYLHIFDLLHAFVFDFIHFYLNRLAEILGLLVFIKVLLSVTEFSCLVVL
jgi:hypothetical protein